MYTQDPNIDRKKLITEIKSIKKLMCELDAPVDELYTGKHRAIGFQYSQRKPSIYAVTLKLKDNSLGKLKRIQKKLEKYIESLGVEVEALFQEDVCMIFYDALNNSESYSIVEEIGKFLNKFKIKPVEAILGSPLNPKFSKSVINLFKPETPQGITSLGTIPYDDSFDDDDEEAPDEIVAEQ